MHYTWHRVDRFYCVFETIIPSNVCHRKTFAAFCHRKGFMGNYNVFFFHESFSIHSDTKLFRTIYIKGHLLRAFQLINRSINDVLYLFILIFIFLTLLLFSLILYLNVCRYEAFDWPPSLYYFSDQYWTYYLSLLIAFILAIFGYTFNIC